MVICNYFLNGSCRFGGKCLNDHIDLKNLIQTEVDSARQGNQYPLSTFGPFKEKPSLQNFISDVSFEELRWNFIEAQTTGNIQNFSMQYHQQFNEANNKMQSLKSMTPEMVNVIVGLYNSELTSDSIQQQPTMAPKNVFSSNFGTPPAQTSSIFGNSSNSTFGAPTTNIFSNSGSSFGQTQPAANTGSIFGGSNFGAAAANPGSIFGNSSNSTPQNAFGSFAQPPAAQPASSIFGNNTSISSNSFGGTGDSLFGAPAQPANIFAQAVTQTPSNSIFGSNTFASPVQQSTFGQSAFPQTVPQQQSFMPQQAPASIFSQNVFGAPQQQQQPLPQASVFAQNFEGNSMQAQDQSPFANSPFAMQNTQPPQVSQNIFQQQQHQDSGFQNQNASVFSIQKPQAQVDMNNYSRMEDLSAEDVEAFRAERFILGKIPIIAPCREFCF